MSEFFELILVVLFDKKMFFLYNINLYTYHPLITAQHPEKKAGALVMRQTPSLSG